MLPLRRKTVDRALVLAASLPAVPAGRTFRVHRGGICHATQRVAVGSGIPGLAPEFEFPSLHEFCRAILRARCEAAQFSLADKSNAFAYRAAFLRRAPIVDDGKPQSLHVASPETQWQAIGFCDAKHDRSSTAHL